MTHLTIKSENKTQGSFPANQSDSFLLKAVISGQVCAVVSAALNGFDVTKIRMQNQGSYILRSEQYYDGFLQGRLG